MHANAPIQNSEMENKIAINCEKKINYKQKVVEIKYLSFVFKVNIKMLLKKWHNKIWTFQVN